MPNVSTSNAIKIASQGMINLIKKHPLAISLEVTHSCNCNCKHCDKGGMIPNEKLASPQRFGEVVREIKPLIAQISGGEPLLRDDIFDIVKEIKNWGRLPYMIFITNAWLLTEEKYLKLKELGIDEFGISLDFPDERHDKNRGISGLYKHLDTLLPKIASYNNRDIALISVIRNENIADLLKIAEHAVLWNVAVNFSIYTPLRTGDLSFAATDKDRLREFREKIDQLIDFKRKTGRIFTTESVLKKYYEFFANNCFIPNCQAGRRSAVINPDGRIASCAMQAGSYDTLDELVNNFSKGNSCGGCYVSLRANTEKTFGMLLKDGWSSYRQMRRNGN